MHYLCRYRHILWESIQSSFKTTRVLTLLLLVGATLSPGCGLPKDIEGTLDRVSGGVLNVGVTENAPWVMRDGQGATGLEPEIIKALAEQLNADVRWHWGSEAELLEALTQFQLDMVVGGFTKNKRISLAAAPTKPYFTSRSTVGFPSSQPLPASLEGVPVALKTVNHLHKPLIEHGAVPEVRAKPQEANIAVAGPDWWLHAHGFEPGPWELASDQHVMALPKGENGWMLTVQRHLNSLTSLDKRIQQWEAK